MLINNHILIKLLLKNNACEKERGKNEQKILKHSFDEAIVKDKYDFCFIFTVAQSSLHFILTNPIQMILSFYYQLEYINLVRVLTGIGK